MAKRTTKPVTRKRAAKRAAAPKTSGKKPAAAASPQLEELRLGLEALRAGLRETVGQYLARIDAQLGEILSGLETRPSAVERLQELELKTLRRIKPSKGRLKDLARFEGLAEKLKELK